MPAVTRSQRKPAHAFGGGRGSGSARTASGGGSARTYQRNAAFDGAKGIFGVVLAALRRLSRIVWLAGTNLDRIPRSSEVPLVAGVLAAWAFLSVGRILFIELTLLQFSTVIGLICGYTVGAYRMVMELPGGAPLAATMCLIDLLFIVSGIPARLLVLLIYSAVLLVGIRDWRSLFAR